MWIELLFGFMVWCGLVFLFLKLKEDYNIRKLRRRYKKEDDPGRESKEGSNIRIGFRESPSDSERKPELQNAIINAKQELLQSGVSGGDNGDEQSDSDAKPND